MAVRGLHADQLFYSYGLDLTRGGKLCFTKALMAGLDPENGCDFTVYSNYLDMFLLTDQDSRISSLLGRPYLRDKLRMQLFHSSKPSREPQLFSFGSSPCLARLSRQAGLELVVYRLTGETVIPYCDFRLVNGKSDARDRPSLGVLFGCGQLGERFLRFEDVEMLDREFNTLAFNEVFSFSDNSSHVSQWKCPEGRCQLMQAMERVLLAGGILPAPLDGRGAQGFSLELHPGELAEDQGEISKMLWTRWKTSVLVVAFSHASLSMEKADKKKWRVYNVDYKKSISLKPSQCTFTVLCLVGPHGETPESVAELKELSGAPVIGLWGSGLCALLSPAHAKEVRNSFFRTEGSGERVANSKLRSFAPPSKVRMAERLTQLAAKRSLKTRKINEMRKRCECQLCSKAEEYDQNMSKAGPEHLIATDYTLKQLLQMLGLWRDGRTNQVLDRVCELSVASMDIESRTVSLDMTPPGPGPKVKYAEIDIAALENHPRFVQVPVMMAHMDGLSASQNPQGIFSVSDDSEQAIRVMMKDYLEWILKSQRACSAVKAKMLAPYLAVTGRYKRAFFDYCKVWREQNLQEFEREDRLVRNKRLGGKHCGSNVHSGVDPVGGRTSAETISRSPACDGWNWDDFIIPKTPAATDREAGCNAEAGSRKSEDAYKDDADDDHAAADDDRNAVARADEDEDEDDDNRNGAESADSDQEMLYHASMKILVNSRPRCLLQPEHQRYLDSFPAEDKQHKKKTKDFHYLTTRAWSHTLPGRLEKLLLRLINDYSVFSFYG